MRSAAAPRRAATGRPSRRCEPGPSPAPRPPTRAGALLRPVALRGSRMPPSPRGAAPSVSPSLRERDARAAPIEPEVERLQVGERRAHRRLRILRTIEQQEAAAAGAGDLAAERAGGARAVVEAVDRGVADLVGHAALHLPAAVERAAKPVEVAGD